MNLDKIEQLHEQLKTRLSPEEYDLMTDLIELELEAEAESNQ